MTRPLHVYLAGPMTGIAEFNFPAFDAAAEALRDRGHVAFNPAENDRDKHGFDPTGMTGHEDLTGILDRRKALGDDLAWICAEADVVAPLPGWQWSTGARAEVAVARALNILAVSARGLIAGEVTL